MLPKHLIDKVRRGACSAALIAALGTGGSVHADDKDQKPASTQAVETALNAEQLATVRKTIPLLGAEDFNTRESASSTLRGFGKAVVPSLQEALKQQVDPEVKFRLTAIIKLFTEPAPQTVQAEEQVERCRKCGRG